MIVQCGVECCECFGEIGEIECDELGARSPARAERLELEEVLAEFVHRRDGHLVEAFDRPGEEGIGLALRATLECGAHALLELACCLFGEGDGGDVCRFVPCGEERRDAIGEY